MAKIYREADADLGALKGKKIGIIGYGIQGRSQSLNLRDSGLDVLVSDLPGSTNWKMAEQDKMSPRPTPEVAAAADLIQILTEDHVQAAVYRTQIAEHLKEGKALVFSHGFNIHYHQIVPPPNVDVFMVAPKGPGALVRELFVQKRGVPGLVAIHQDYTGKAKTLALAYAKGIGCTRGGVLETTFAEETETDLFGEQAVLCGGVSELVKAGFDTLVEAGYQPESAYLEVCHELKLIVDLIQKYGISGMRKRVSDTAEYGDMTRGPRVISEAVRAEMRCLLEEVRDGTFAREWILENQAGRPVFKALEKREAEHLIEKVGAEIRAMMPWLQE
jgi:ketol-acid reductoisomerase